MTGKGAVLTVADTHTGGVPRWTGGLLGSHSTAFPARSSIFFLLPCQVLVWGTEESCLESALKHPNTFSFLFSQTWGNGGAFAVSKRLMGC